MRETHKIVQRDWGWVFKWTKEECEGFKANALTSRHMSTPKVERWIITTN
jgi:hypothetical protein